MQRILPLLLTCSCIATAAAQHSSLSVNRIMQNPKTYIGSWPSTPFWSEDGETLYFRWNPMGAFPADSLYSVSRTGETATKVLPEERRNLGPTFDGWNHGEWVYDGDHSRKVYAHNGDIYVYDRTDGNTLRLTRTRESERSPRFAPDGNSVVFRRSDNLFRLDLQSGATHQLTDIREGPDPKDDDEENNFLESQQLRLFSIIRKDKEQREQREAARERDQEPGPPTHYLDDRNIQQLRVDPTERYVSFATVKQARNTPTMGIAFVTESGYAEHLSGRPKVGMDAASFKLHLQDLSRDTTMQIDLHQIPGTYDVHEFQREQGMELDSSKTKRDIFAFGPYWSEDGRHAVVEVRARDNKDRWLCRLDPESGALDVLDRQHDEAWIAGPGMSWFGGQSLVGFIPGTDLFYFQSEATGYSHLYTVDVSNGDVNQLTHGEYEVFSPELSKDGTSWYFTSGLTTPHERQLYTMPVSGGEPRQLTSMPGNNVVVMNPREDMMAILHSQPNRPPEVFVQDQELRRITFSQTDEYLSYDWRIPKTVWFEASDGVQVPAHVFEPEVPNGAGVLFVHGAGYLQNVHNWWSSYYREYMFHNLLADLGYTVMQVDYRGSAGYGRDWRTAIYRHMGGRDLQDYVDASGYLGTTYDIDPERVAIYGGSYGGFITLMALFTEAEHFGAGAALRSVTDWAHYNHGYTSNILNTPEEDSLAYARSSPINFAEGLEDPLLMPHGMVDLNVQFQDIVRLAQRLIELEKDDWELAVYPVEGHSFQEPSSWRDEYSRILKLIEQEVGLSSN